MSQNPADAPDTAAPGTETPASAPVSGAGLKVELDIEDAPFLEDEEEEAPEPEPEAAEEAAPKPAAVSAAPKEKKNFLAFLAPLLANKKRLAIIGGGLVVILLLPLVLLLFGGKKEAPPPPPPVAEPTRIVTPEPKAEEAPAGPKFLFRADPFFLERRGSEGEIRFLRCRFTVPTDNPALFNELRAKNIAVRDAIYYYLVNKPLVFLNDPQSQTALKQDLISVINEHVATEKISELYIEDYFVSGR